MTISLFLWRAAEWQPVEKGPSSQTHRHRAHQVFGAARAGSIVQAGNRLLSSRMQRFIPRRIATVIGLLFTVLLIWSITNNLLIRTAFDSLDSSFREFDALLVPERPQPVAVGRTGSATSLLKWNELGRAGRGFVVSGPRAAQFGAFAGRPGRETVRV
ncbi:alpha/beta-hydrolase N-terminal domain-containing protein [Bradyrhizobium sp. CCBAU 51765]|uniref:alpha/beta-hydrolase N-terminal domain-containing protein n=1 Tax=Bradyrhizobium sp. CCBAU 51765 TaxID=1325102 RepID=UPI0018884415|nr:alpha/beta-hydrolase N-terminal domain-containing protein [Bradyrhizobium sp. CCBAU 51765]